MKQVLLLIAALVVISGLSGCAGFVRAPVVPPNAIVYTDTSAPLDHNMDKTDLGAKTGEASSFNILGIAAWGDASVAAAAKQGGVKTVKHADYDFFNVLGIYSRFTTRVHGD